MSFGCDIFDSSRDNISIKDKKYENEFYSCFLKTDIGDYELFLLIKLDKFILNTESEIVFLSLYSYSKELTFGLFKKLFNNFNSCNNIHQKFISFINILNVIAIEINSS